MKREKRATRSLCVLCNFLKKESAKRTACCDELYCLHRRNQHGEVPDLEPVECISSLVVFAGSYPHFVDWRRKLCVRQASAVTPPARYTAFTRTSFAMHLFSAFFEVSQRKPDAHSRKNPAAPPYGILAGHSRKTATRARENDPVCKKCRPPQRML